MPSIPLHEEFAGGAVVILLDAREAAHLRELLQSRGHAEIHLHQRGTAETLYRSLTVDALDQDHFDWLTGVQEGDHRWLAVTIKGPDAPPAAGQSHQPADHPESDPPSQA
ncbi:MAG: hypothetical protein IT430_14320 [Phycisphaerales bacterium]|nr:hypothetical protein [Phycisphaerales bacterium]